MMGSLRFVVALSAAIALANPALAGGKGDTAKSQEKTARAACLMGDYQKGTKILVDLFIETGNPVHLFNQGRCYEQNHRWEQAVDRFHEYLRKAPKLDADTRAYVDKHLAECESHLPKATPVQTPAPVTPVQTPPPAPTPAPEPEAEKPSANAGPVSPTPPARANDSGSTLRILGIVTAALGVASLGYGTYEYFRRESLVEDLRKKGDHYSDDQYSDKQGQIDASKTRGLIGFGVGAAALVAGTTMYLLGRASASSGTEHAAIALVPGIGPGQTSLFISGAF
jgi:hypothetical protein